jgi:hypothetical protein
LEFLLVSDLIGILCQCKNRAKSMNLIYSMNINWLA